MIFVSAGAINSSAESIGNPIVFSVLMLLPLVIFVGCVIYDLVNEKNEIRQKSS